jgi:hypothetical protein
MISYMSIISKINLPSIEGNIQALKEIKPM